jgi:hypothetical protein
MTKTSKHKSHSNSGTVDNRDLLKPGEWDRSGAGELGGDEPSTVGARPKRDDEHTSAGD